MIALINRYRYIIKESIWLTLGQIFSIIGSLFVVRILTDNLSIEQFGELSLSLSIAAFVGQVILGGFINGFSRFYSIAENKNDLLAYFKSVQRLLLKALLVTFLVFFFISFFLEDIFKIKQKLIILPVFLFTYLSSCNAAFSGILSAARKRKIVTFLSAAELVIKILMLLLFFSINKKNSYFVIYSSLVSFILIIFLQIRTINKLVSKNKVSSIQNNISWDLLIWKFSYPFSIWGIFTSLQVASDKWALNRFSDLRNVGIYSIVYQFGWSPISLITNLFMNLISPILYSKVGDMENKDNNSHNTKILFLLTVISLILTLFVFFLTFFFHKSIFEILVSISFRKFSYLLPYVVLASGLFATGQILSIKLLTDLDTKKLMSIKISTAIFGFVFNFIGVYFFGIIGAIIGLNLFSLFYFIFIFIVSFKKSDLKFK